MAASPPGSHRPTPIALVLLPSAILAIAVGCGTRTALDVPPAVDERSFPAKLAAILCEKASECCFGAGLDPPAASCLADQTAHYEQLAQHARALGAPFDGEHAAACLRALESAPSRCPSYKEMNFPLDCLDVYLGAKPPGASCELSWGECASAPGYHGSCWQETWSGGQSTLCGQSAIANDGEWCGGGGGTALNCVDGSYCDAESRCAKRPGAGQACFDQGVLGDVCAAGSLCQSPDSGAAGACAPPPKRPGEACNDSWECEGVACVNGRCRLWGVFAGPLCGGW